MHNKKNTTLFARKKRAKPKVSIKKKKKRKKLYTQKTQLFCKEEESQSQSK
jgi:hypothetical protein